MCGSTTGCREAEAVISSEGEATNVVVPLCL